MGISLNQYRCVIGLFNANCVQCSAKCLNCKMYICKYLNLLLFCTLSLTLMILLLLQCGDIHSNPGPINSLSLSLSICHLNIRSIRFERNSLFNLKLALIRNELANQFDIITLSETWLCNNDDIDRYYIEGFQSPFILNRPGTINGGGVMCWVKNNIAAKRKSNFEISGLEALWIEIKTGNGKFNLCTIYRAPNTNNDFWESLQSSIDLAKASDVSSIFITGDLNAHTATINGRRLHDFAYVNGLKVMISEPTRITDTSSTILDQFLTNIPDLIKSVHVYPPLANNDHCTISAFLNFRTKPSQSYDRVMWDFKSTDFKCYHEALANTDWESHLDNTQNVDNLCNTFTDTLLNICKMHIPNKTVKVRPSSKPFYNGYLRRLKRKLNRFHQNAKISNTMENWARFRHERNHYINEVKRCKEDFDNKKYQSINNANPNSKTYYNLTKQLVGPFKDNSLPPMLSEGNNLIVSDIEKASAFNAFFAKASALDDSEALLPQNCEPYIGISTLSEIKVTEQDVKDQLHILDANKSYGHDNISPVFLKQSKNSLVKPLTLLFNSSLSKSVFPHNWKLANVLPLYKKGSKNLLNNYRPVSLLCSLGKILERIVFKYVFNHFRDNFLISIWQSGFLPGSSTVTQLIEMHYQFCKAVSENKEVRVVFLDISKAFDRVWHKGLLYKLQKWGICDPLLSWFKSYLSDRYQRVLVNGQKSEFIKITAGVPQGSVLGPLLFLVYINDLVYVVKYCKIRLFADDTCLFITVDDKFVAANQINSDLDAIEKWSKQWLVSFSAPKTVSMIVGHKNQQHPPIYFQNLLIKNVQQHKHVGLWLQSNLWWNYHINEISLKASKKLNILKHFKHKLSRQTLENMYLTFVRPLLEYSSVVWAGAHCTNLIKLDKIQVDALRIVTGCTERSNIANLYKDCDWDSLEKRRENHILKMIYKIINDQAPLYLKEILPKKISEIVPYSVRNSQNFKIPFCRTQSFSRSFIPFGCTLWNELDLNYRQALTLSSFNNLLQSSINKEERKKKNCCLIMVREI